MSDPSGDFTPENSGIFLGETWEYNGKRWCAGSPGMNPSDDNQQG